MKSIVDELYGKLSEASSGKAQLYLGSINLGEIFCIIGRRLGEGRATETLTDIDRLPLEIAEASRARVLAAARIKSQHAISSADAFAVALAQELKCVVVTGDPELKLVEAIVPVRFL
ncbi:MAG: type II toxin-antitoxin system VapC family toxin [Syntrophobacteraceae bacterium]